MCQYRMLPSEASRTLALPRHRCQNRDTGLLKPPKTSSEATPQASKTAGSPQQSSIELAVSTGVSLQDIVELTMSTVRKGATLSLALPCRRLGTAGLVCPTKILWAPVCHQSFCCSLEVVESNSWSHGDVRLILPLCLFILFDLRSDQFLSGRVPGSGIWWNWCSVKGRCWHSSVTVYRCIRLSCPFGLTEARLPWRLCSCTPNIPVWVSSRISGGLTPLRSYFLSFEKLEFAEMMLWKFLQFSKEQLLETSES